MANEYKSYISHKDFTIEIKTKIEQDIKRYPLYDAFWDKLCDHKKWTKGSRSVSWRQLAKPELADSDITPLVEGVAAAPRGLKVVEYTANVDSYGTYFPYTRESIIYNYDDTLEMIDHNARYIGNKVPDVIKGKKFIASRYQLTKRDTVTETFDDALIYLKTNNAQPMMNGRYAIITTSEVIRALKKELRAAGEVLTPAQKDDISVKGTVYDYDGFYIMERNDDFLITTGTGGKDHYIIFLGKSEDGLNSITALEGGEPEILLNGLGSGVVKDSTGNIVSDSNARVGSVALNIDGLGVASQCDYCRLTCKYLIADGTDPVTSETPGNTNITATNDFSTLPRS